VVARLLLKRPFSLDIILLPYITRLLKILAADGRALPFGSCWFFLLENAGRFSGFVMELSLKFDLSCEFTCEEMIG